VGGLHVLQGKITIGTLLVFLSYVGVIYGPLEVLAYVSADLATVAARARRVNQIMGSEDEVRDRPGAGILARAPEGGASVRLEQVTFGYEPDRPVLQDVSLAAEPGETIALVGHTGAGKTTVASLILRFFDPWQGRVVVNGTDVRDVTLQSLRSQVALVLQDPFLLPLPVSENIGYGRPEASQEEIEAAAVAANADEFIRRLPEGYDTVIGERGATLSGGERQRLAIARALLKDAPILILDEPTASLDAQTEASLMQAIERLMKGRTTFIIAHRLSTIRRATRIVVLEHGRVVETGTHQELVDRDGLYRRLHMLQVGTDIVAEVAR
jgi:ATP-binding cassette subfamily B protein/subfamily B ATP-binding cassette protein MsbA